MDNRGFGRGKFVPSRAPVKPPLRVFSYKENLGANALKADNRHRNLGKRNVHDQMGNKQPPRKFGVNLTNAQSVRSQRIKNRKTGESNRGQTSSVKLRRCKVMLQTRKSVKLGTTVEAGDIPRPSFVNSNRRCSLKKPPKVYALVKRSLDRTKPGSGNARPAIVVPSKANERSRRTLGRGSLDKNTDDSQISTNSLENRAERAFTRHLRRMNPDYPSNSTRTLQASSRDKNAYPRKGKGRQQRYVARTSWGSSKGNSVAHRNSIDSCSTIDKAEPSKTKAMSQRAFSTTLTLRSERFSRATDLQGCAEEVPSIDVADIGNPLAVAEYVDDIYAFYWETERGSVLPAADYMLKQDDLNPKMRAVLMNWLFEVHLTFRMMPETLFLMSTIIDKFLSLETISRQSLQLVGITAMLIAAKYEEIWPPKIRDLVAISNHAYTCQQVLSMEKIMLKKLRFNLAFPTPYVFLKRFLKAAEANKQMEYLSFYLAELSLVEYSSLRWKPSMLAAASVHLARRLLRKKPIWTKLLRKHARYEESQLKECTNMVAVFHKNAASGALKAVHTKYSGKQFGAVAKLFNSR